MAGTVSYMCVVFVCVCKHTYICTQYCFQPKSITQNLISLAVLLRHSQVQNVFRSLPTGSYEIWKKNFFLLTSITEQWKGLELDFFTHCLTSLCPETSLYTNCTTSIHIIILNLALFSFVFPGVLGEGFQVVQEFCWVSLEFWVDTAVCMAGQNQWIIVYGIVHCGNW